MTSQPSQAGRDAAPVQSPLGRITSVLYKMVRIYVLLVVIVYFFQDYLLYRPPTYTMAEARALATQLGLKTYSSSGSVGEGKSATSWENVAYTTVAPPAGPVRGTIVVAHGNAGSALYSTVFSDALTPLGFRVILYEYPGYGSNPGRPSEATCVEPLQRLVREVASASHGGRIYLFGQSMGCGIVCSALRDGTLPVDGVILMQPWDSLAGAGTHHFPFLPAALMVGKKYNSRANLAAFTGPVAFVVCQNDRTIPPVLSKRLFDSYAGRKTWLELPDSDHNNWPGEPDLMWWRTITDFIASAPVNSGAAATDPASPPLLQLIPSSSPPHSLP